MGQQGRTDRVPQVEEIAETQEPEGSGCGGVVVLAGAAALALTVLWRLAPNLFVLAVWGIGWGAVIWVAKKTPKIDNPSPPPPPERGTEKDPQVNVVRDTTHPNRWLVTRQSAWVTEEINKETGTS